MNPARCRVLYPRLCDPESGAPDGATVAALRAELVPTGAADPAVLAAEASAWSADEAGRFRELVVDGDARAVLARRAALGCAPVGLLAGAWLQWFTDPSTADDPLALRVLARYAADVGVGHAAASRGSAYLALLRRLGVAAYAAPAGRIALDRRVPDGCFSLPARLLAISRRPDDFRAEILGADLCLRAVGLLPALTVVSDVDTRLGLSGQDPPDVTDVGSPERVTAGFRWAFEHLRRWSGELLADLAAARDPAYEMAELVRGRAAEAAVYHDGFALEGRLLSQWLKEAVTDPLPLLDALAGSRLVTPGRSATSRLVTTLVGERGPMFRIFSADDLAVIRRWIDALPAATATAVPPAPAPVRIPDPRAGDGGRAPASLREAYHLLQTRTDDPALRAWALGYARDWLHRSDPGRDDDPTQLPAAWPAAGLRPWLGEQHARHDREFATDPPPVPSRQALVDSTVQLAPLTLIDGAWLRGFTDYAAAESEIGHFLFETYWDELGNGLPELNHPLIYREVLDEMGVRLPPTGAREFAQWPGFREESLELPVYWLSVGRFPRTFLPEILGLNLAMELSGVGGSYRTARIALKQHGFSTRFVDIHNTIDNVASGHSAWAADAVDSYLATVPVTQGAAALDDVWQRVRTGFRSLSPPRARARRLALSRRGRR